MKVVLVGLGRLIIVAGAFVVWGNLSGRFRTVPLTGVVVMAIGGILVALVRDAGT